MQLKMNKCPHKWNLFSVEKKVKPYWDETWQAAKNSASFIIISTSMVNFTLVAFWVDTVCLDSVLILTEPQILLFL